MGCAAPGQPRPSRLLLRDSATKTRAVTLPPGRHLLTGMGQPTRNEPAIGDVLDAAWRGSGTPSPPETARRGRCARCGDTAALTPVRAAVSKVFTGFEGWDNPSGAGLCARCSWAYTTPVLRTGIHLVTRRPASCQQIERAGAAAILCHALHSGAALVVPLRPGRKHLLPVATWGQVTTDTGRLPWGQREAGLLELVGQLRADGFGSRMLQAAAPPFQVFHSLPRDRWQPVQVAWQALAPWRAPDNPWFPLALHLTTPTSTKELATP